MIQCRVMYEGAEKIRREQDFVNGKTRDVNGDMKKMHKSILIIAGICVLINQAQAGFIAAGRDISHE